MKSARIAATRNIRVSGLNLQSDVKSAQIAGNLLHNPERLLPVHIFDIDVTHGARYERGMRNT